MVDPNAVLRAHLLTVSGVTAVVGDRVWAVLLKPGYTPSVGPAVTFACRGGRTNPHVPDLPSATVQIQCWGSTPFVARSLYGAVYDALQGVERVQVGSNVIDSMVEDVAGQDLVDPGTEWPNVLSIWTLLVR
ncbi:MAG: hypothetical protein GHCLOJNM_01571 [bacterium]|nr:hypothetical protein [bacterium]